MKGSVAGKPLRRLEGIIIKQNYQNSYKARPELLDTKCGDKKFDELARVNEYLWRVDAHKTNFLDTY